MQRFIYAWIVFLIYILFTSGVHAIFHIPYLLLHLLLGFSFYFIYGLKGALLAGFLVLIMMLFGFSYISFISNPQPWSMTTELLQKMLRNYSNALFFIIAGSLIGYGIHVIRRFV